ncbi:MAG: response regulator [Phycisphaerales bacterium]|nr:response regulator [Phycisphaerales bacterium]
MPNSRVTNHEDVHKPDAQELIRTFRSQAPQINRLLDELDKQTERTDDGRLKSPRFSYRKPAVLRLTNTRDNRSQAYLIAPRTLGSKMISFLFGGFVHANTPISVRLTTLYGAWTDHVGIVHDCRHVEANIHEVDLELNEPIDPAMYAAKAAQPRVLVAEDDALFQHLVKQLLGELNAHVELATNGKKAVEMAQAGIYDIVFMDVEMPEMDGITATRTLREAGYTGRIVAATGMTRPEYKAKCLEAGCDGYISKPYKRSDLEDAIRSLQGEPIFSEFEHVASMREVVAMYVKDLPNRISAITSALATNNAEATECALRSLKSISGSCGFAAFSEISATIESRIIAGEPLSAVRGEIQKLVSLCMRARTSQIAASAPSGSAGTDTAG